MRTKAKAHAECAMGTCGGREENVSTWSRAKGFVASVAFIRDAMVNLRGKGKHRCPSELNAEEKKLETRLSKRMPSSFHLCDERNDWRKHPSSYTLQGYVSARSISDGLCNILQI